MDIGNKAFKAVALLVLFSAVQDLAATDPKKVSGGVPELEEFEAVDLSGQRWNDRSLQGKVVLIDFWATWCVPCRKEIPELKKLYREYHSEGLEILGVSLDTAGRLELERYLRRHGIHWPQIADFKGYSGRLASQYDVEAIPRSYLFDREGRLVGVNLTDEVLLRKVEVLCSR